MRRSLVLALSVLACALSRSARAADADIRINQIGYIPERAKRASVVATATEFDVKRKADASVAFHGALAGPITDPDTNESVWIADYTTLTDEGDYYLEVPGVGRSPDFPIGRASYQNAMLATMLGFFGWRCNTDVSLSWQGSTFSHAACHMDDAHTDYIGAAGTRDGRKGWHDAGDYGKYTVNAGVTVGVMLQAWEDFGSALAKVTLPIPEAGGTVPDYLDEIRWELEWVLKMQYSATDGRVSHKLTSKRFDVTDYVFVMPENDLMTRYYTPAGTLAAADFVAMLAKAARAYQKYDPAFAQQCLDAAKVSYAYLVQNTGYVNADALARRPLGFVTGGYEANDASDRVWAAAEMWETTGDAAALADFEARVQTIKTKIDVGYDWGKVGTLGVLVYALSQREGRDPNVLGAIETEILGTADWIITNDLASGYGRGLGAGLYWWGSNGSVARICTILGAAYRLTGVPDYLDACVDQIGWLLGRNYYGRSFVTGVGDKPPLYPGHRPSDIDGVTPPWPGLLEGGPTTPTNWSDNKPTQTGHYAWDRNEVAVNWNGALAYALAAMLEPPPVVVPVIDAGRLDGLAPEGGGAGDGQPGDAAGEWDGMSGTGADDVSALPGSVEESAAPLSTGGGCGCRAGTSATSAPWIVLAASLLFRRRAHRRRVAL